MKDQSINSVLFVIPGGDRTCATFGGYDTVTDVESDHNLIVLLARRSRSRSEPYPDPGSTFSFSVREILKILEEYTFFSFLKQTPTSAIDLQA